MFETIKQEHVGKAFTQFFGHTWLSSNWIGRILPQDVGKRVYLVRDILQVENQEQMEARR